MSSSLSALLWRKLAAEASLLVHAAVVADAPTGEVLYASELAESMFGYAPGGLAGRCVDDLLPADSRDRHAAYRAGFAEHPRARPMGHGMPLFGCRRDGTTFPVQISLSPVEAIGRNVVVAFAVDLSGAINTAVRMATTVHDEIRAGESGATRTRQPPAESK